MQYGPITNRHHIRTLALAAALLVFGGGEPRAEDCTVVITVGPPSQIIGTFSDTQEIRNAFAQAEDKTNCVIQLGEGTYRIIEPITVKNFSGTFKGRGKDHTTIHVSGRPKRLIGSGTFTTEDFPLRTAGPETKVPSAFFFYRDDHPLQADEIVIEDMSIVFLGRTADWTISAITNSETHSYQNDVLLLNFRGVANDVPDDRVTRTDVAVRNLKLSGRRVEGFLSSYNVHAGISVYGEQEITDDDGLKRMELISGRLTVHGVEFDSMSVGIVTGNWWTTDLFARFLPAVVNIGGLSNEARNNFTNVLTGIRLFDAHGAFINVRNNEFQTSDLSILILEDSLADFGAADGRRGRIGFGGSSRYRIQDNIFDGVAGSTGILGAKLDASGPGCPDTNGICPPYPFSPNLSIIGNDFLANSDSGLAIDLINVSAHIRNNCGINSDNTSFFGSEVTVDQFGLFGNWLCFRLFSG